MSDISLDGVRVEDRASIMSLIFRYCVQATATADFDGLGALFTPEAAIRFPDGNEVAGPAGMSAALSDNMPALLRHNVTGIDIRFGGPKTAEVMTLVIAVTDRAAPGHWGYWQDRFVKQADGRWLIDDRSIVVEGGAPDGWLAAQQ